MGIVLRQGFKNTIFTYLGFLVGAIYTILLVPKVFDTHPEHWGTARFLVSYALVIAPWAQLSIPNIIIRYFPIFKSKNKESFVFFIIFWTSTGIIISSLFIIFFSHLWFTPTSNKLIIQNSFLVFPIFIGYILFEVAAAFSKSLFKSTIPIFLKEFLLRFNVLALIILYWYNLINFTQFIYLFAFNYVLIFIILFLYLFSLKKLSLKINFDVIKESDFRPIYTYAIFNILSVSAGMLILNIDTLMINHYLSLKDVAIYGPSLFIASSILVPSRSLQSIIAPVVANSWATNDLNTIKELYKRSAIAPLTITIFLFLIIWINIDLVMNYFGKTFGQGKYVVLLLSLGHIINIATGINGTIINTSKHYKADLYFQIILVTLAVVMNIIFIPIYGLNGAALASAITFGLYNFFKSMYVLYKFKLHPYSIKSLYILIIGASIFLIYSIVPKWNLFWSSVLYSIVLSIIYWIIVYFANISEDINKLINKLKITK